MKLSTLLLTSIFIAAPALAAPPEGKGGGKGGGNDPVGLAEAFDAIQADTIWAVPSSPQEEISSTFGPRIRTSTAAYDWHRGLDIHGETGDPILASYDGEFVGIRQYTNGGTTVIIEHAFAQPVSFQGQEIDRWYTLYMHMDAVDADLVAADAAGNHPVISAGDQIGTVGTSGSTVTPHLHQEIRVGSRCSLEFQLNNPSSGCSGLYFDPHVHPLFLHPDEANDLSLSVATGLSGLQDGIIEISSLDRHPDINRYEFQIRSRKKVIDSFVLDLNLRTGFDATSEAALDTPDTAKPHLSPEPFGYSANRWTTNLVIPAGFVPTKNSGETFRVIVTDIWGNESAINFGNKNETW